MSTRLKPEPPPVGRRIASRSLLAILAIGLGAACTGAEERPSEAAWSSEWEARQASIPDAAAILSGGRDLCDELDGQFRVSLPELLPSPAEVLDDPVNEWISHAVSIVFECSDDETTLVEQFGTLEVLAEEIDGGLAAEAS